MDPFGSPTRAHACWLRYGGSRRFPVRLTTFLVLVSSAGLLFFWRSHLCVCVCRLSSPTKGSRKIWCLGSNIVNRLQHCIDPRLHQVLRGVQYCTVDVLVWSIKLYVVALFYPFCRYLFASIFYPFCQYLLSFLPVFYPFCQYLLSFLSVSFILFVSIFYPFCQYILSFLPVSFILFVIINIFYSPFPFFAIWHNEQQMNDL